MISEFMKKHFKHFNSAVCVDAAEGYLDVLNKNGKMLITLAGAMSTAELGMSLSELIRNDMIHAISSTGANLEEDIYNLVAHNHYKRIPNYRYLTKEDEENLLKECLNRVTDTCIPEEEAFRKIERNILSLWQKAEKENKRYFPYEYFYQLFDSKVLEKHFQIDPKDSWVYAAYEKNIPIFTPGWEDSTLGNIFVSNILRKNISKYDIVKSGPEQMAKLIDWYLKTSKTSPIGFFQIGGGIAGDFPICVVPLITQDLKQKCPLWSYFCQISDSTTSYGSYSGATPNEKITWGKLSSKTPSFIIESDATIVAPLIFQYLIENKTLKSKVKK
ncbi:MAG: deoxyhypusine synthase family protein [Parachlamydiales bacterium]|nr:deoxyhypusine synthase family protein [Parachlamydiales bacterium]